MCPRTRICLILSSWPGRVFSAAKAGDQEWAHTDAVGMQEIGIKVVRKRPRESSADGGGKASQPYKTPSPGHTAKKEGKKEGSKVKRVSVEGSHHFPENSGEKDERRATSTTLGGVRAPPAEGGSVRESGSSAPMEGQNQKTPNGTHGTPGAEHPPAEARSAVPATPTGVGEGAEEGATAAQSAKKKKMNGTVHAAPAAETREMILETRQQLPIFLARKEILFELRWVCFLGEAGTWFDGECFSHRMYLLISFRKSTPPQIRQLIVYHN